MLNSWLASWPFVSATYITSRTTLVQIYPIPDSIKADFIPRGEADVYLPVSIGKTDESASVGRRFCGVQGDYRFEQAVAIAKQRAVARQSGQ